MAEQQTCEDTCATPYKTGNILRILRSPLFVPGDSQRKIAKAADAGADCLILDLEDSVAPSAKPMARDLVKACLDQPRSSRICVRVNAMDTQWHRDDLGAIIAGQPDYIMLPKCTGAADIVRLDDTLSALEAAHGLVQGLIGIIPLVTETAASLRGMDYRGVSGRLRALAFAAEDLAADLGVVPRDAHGMLNPLLVHARIAVILAATEAGLIALDTPFPDPADEAGLVRETQDAAVLAYSGKLCIHPRQMSPVQGVLTPDDERIRWSRAVVAAFDAAPGEGVALLNGTMVDKAHLRLALRVLEKADVEGAVA